ncbi:hypothetical protein Goari_010449 [Gossypium aridum]|uniref:Uncharacterized protein n=1 Tax=Gossypium aridum TaxID=34290 RepID=A0A7J8Y046_GOSAI|nr:hypothetical protein [Gossypium aridum]
MNSWSIFLNKLNFLRS